MNWINMFRAEWMKTVRRPANLGIIGFQAAILSAGIGLMTLNALKNTETLKRAATILPFPSNLRFATNMLWEIGALLAVLFISNSVGSEYVRDTWKMILPRRGDRWSFLTMKILTGGGGLIVLFTFSLALVVLLGTTGAAILKLDPFQPISTAQIGVLLKSLGGIALGMTCYGMLALAVTVSVRSTFGGAMVGVLTIPVSSVAAFNSRIAALVLPELHLRNFGAHLTNRTELLSLCSAAFGGNISAATSLWVIAGYTVAFAVVAFIVFTRRDFAG